MSTPSLNRRSALLALGATASTSLLPQSVFSKSKSPFVYCLNMSTIRGQKLGFIKELEVASKAGYEAVEIWIDPFLQYLKAGNTAAQLTRQLKDLNLEVANAIGFAQWLVDDETTRNKALDQLKNEMTALASIGCKRIAAPPQGANRTPGLDLRKAAERYRTILEIGDQIGVVPHLELWGSSKNMNRMSEVAFVAIESGHKSAKVLLDVFHLFKGGSNIATLPLIGKAGIEVFHMNDYPATAKPETVSEPDRIYPGDGVAPVLDILKTLKATGDASADHPVVLSIELFNQSYYAQDALVVAKTGLSKLKAIAEKA